VLCLLLTPALAARAQAPGSHSVHGTVIDARSHQPVAHALVFSADQRIAQLTDGDGHFSFELEPAAAAEPPASGAALQFQQNFIVLLSRKPGYLPNALPRIISLADKTAVEATLTLTPAAVIKGRITAPGTDPPAGVQVDLYRRQIQNGVGQWTVMVTKRSNLHGEYRFAELAAGDYKLMTHEWVEPSSNIPVPGRAISGYPPAYYAEAADLASATRLEVRAGDTVDADLTLRQQPYYPVRISVANLAPGGFLDVKVGNENEVSGFALGFNQQTRLIEGSLPSGAYHVSAAVYGAKQAFGATELTVAGAPADGTPLALVPATTLPVIVREEFTSGHAGDIAASAASGPPGFTAQADGDGGETAPTLPVTLSLQPESGGFQAPNIRAPGAGHAGDLVLENVRPGRFRVTATALHGYVASLTSGGVDLLREPLVIGPGGSSAPIEVTLRDDPGTLEVTVPRAHAAPTVFQAGDLLVAVPLEGGGGQPLQGFGDLDGKFTLQAPPGRYLLLAFSAEDQARGQNLEYQNEEAMARYKSKGTIVTVAPREQVHAEVPLLAEDAE
jgi:hypothetical protein